MFKGCGYFIVLIFAFLACEREEDTFTPDVDTSITSEDIEGIWHVFAGEFMGKVVQTPPSFTKCGYDYIVFADNGVYEEVVYDNYDCIPTRESANWKIENGILIVTNTTGEREELPIIEFEPTELVLNFQYDFDNDGSKDVFKAYLRPYDPISNNHIAKSFVRDLNESTLLKFNWNEEKDINSFISYEVYRSEEGKCLKEDAILIAEIDDVSNTTFIDFNPPSTQANLCYFLRVYSSDGLIGESNLLNVNPQELIIPSTITLNSVKVEDENIFLEWSKTNIPYFSHYEIVYSNFDGINGNGLFGEEGTSVSIDNFEVNSFLNTDPPYLENPFFAIKVYNIFGTNLVSNYEQITFRRNDLIGPIYLEHIEVDDEEPVVYLHGSSQIPDWATYNINAVLRLNYDQGFLESTTDDEVYVAGEFPFRKPINFHDGRELVINGRNNLHFLNPTSLSENFSFGSFYLAEEFNLSGIIDFTLTKNGFFVIINSSHVFVFQRNGEELLLLDKQIHYETHHGDNLYRMIQVNDIEIMVGHKREEESILYTVDNNGILQNKRVVSIPLSSSYISKYKNGSFYSDSSSSIINYGDRTLYSTISFQSEVQMSEDLFALGLAKDSKYIFASTINPDWFGSDTKTKLLKREVILFDTETSQTQSIKTKGYPIRVFENNLGEIFSISIPENQLITDFDIFVEKINFP